MGAYNSDATALCRDCFAHFAGATARCPKCGSPRLVTHDELHVLTIAHIDCDAFYASVEKRDRPELRDRPVIVGGGRRGVVSTACYIARICGVHSAMPMFKALKACPDAVVLKPDMKKYVAISRQLRQMMDLLTPAVEPLSIDEAFLDLSGTERLHRASPAETLARFAGTVETHIGVTISIGLAPNKFLAKLASDLDKPRGFSVIGRRNLSETLASKPVRVIWGVGRVMADRLARDGVTHIGQLQALERDELTRRYGAIGTRLADLAHGRDSRAVSRRERVKSISNETTFGADICAHDHLRIILRRLAEKVAHRLKAAHLAGRTVTLKLKTAQFRIITRQRSLHEPTQLAGRIFTTAESLLQNETGERSFRLIGVAVSGLAHEQSADTANLADPDTTRLVRVEHAVDLLRARFGEQIVETGLTHKSACVHKRHETVPPPRVVKPQG